MKKLLCAGLFVALQSAGSSGAFAAVIDAGGLLPGQVNDQNVGSTSASPDTAFVRSTASGRLDSFTVWATAASLNNISSDGFTMSLFGGQDPGSALPLNSDLLAQQSFDANFISGAPVVLSNANTAYRALTWDLSGVNVDTGIGDYLGFRVAPNGTSGSIDISSIFCNFASNACAQAQGAGMLLDRNGTASTFGDPARSSFWMYQLNVDDNPSSDPTDPNVVPLPAGMPLLLAGLGGLALLRRRS